MNRCTKFGEPKCKQATGTKVRQAITKKDKREKRKRNDTGQGQFQSRNRVEMKYRPKDLSKVGIVYATEFKTGVIQVS